MEQSIINKVTASELITFDITTLYPKEPIVIFDLKHYLFMELIVKEKDFRAALQTTDWTLYQNKYVGITCTVDVIIPVWAYMLVATYLQPIAKDIFFGNEERLVEALLLKSIYAIDVTPYIDKRLVVKGCGELPIPESAYVALTYKLTGFVKSLMYGEPCSTVPIYKKK